MMKYLIIMTTKDGLGIEQLSVVKQADTRKGVELLAKDLDPGAYSLISVLRDEFVVRDSYRVHAKVVDWGSSKQPRKRKGNDSTEKTEVEEN